MTQIKKVNNKFMVEVVNLYNKLVDIFPEPQQKIPAFSLNIFDGLIAALKPAATDKIYVNATGYKNLKDLLNLCHSLLEAYRFFREYDAYINFSYKVVLIHELIYKNCQLLVNKNQGQNIDVTIYPNYIQDLLYLYTICWSNNRLNEATTFINKSTPHIKKVGRLVTNGNNDLKEQYRNYIAMYYSCMANLKSLNGDLSNAIIFAAKAETNGEYMKLEDQPTFFLALGQTYNAIANELFTQGGYKKALAYYDKSHEILVSVKSSFINENNLTLSDIDIGNFAATSLINSITAKIEICRNKLSDINARLLFDFLKHQTVDFKVINSYNQKVTLQFALEQTRSRFYAIFAKTNCFSKNKHEQIVIDMISFDINDYAKLKQQFIKAISTKIENPNANSHDQIISPTCETDHQALTDAEEKLQKQERHEENEHKRQVKISTMVKDVTNSKVNYNNNNNDSEKKVKPQADQPLKKTKIIEWDNNYVPPTDLFRVYTSVKNLKTFSTISEDLELPEGISREKLRTVADYGNVLSNENTKGRQGYFFSKSDPVITNLGANYKCKLKLQGTNGDHRVVGYQAATGKEFTYLGDELIKTKNVEVIDFDHFEGTHRKNKS